MSSDKDQFEIEAERMEDEAYRSFREDNEDELELPADDDDRPIWWDDDEYEYYDEDEDDEANFFE